MYDKTTLVCICSTLVKHKTSELRKDNFTITPKVYNERDVSSGVESRGTSPLLSIHIVVSLNYAGWPVVPFMLIKRM